MKRQLNFMFYKLFFASIYAFLFCLLPIISFSQGINNNIWIFGDCNPGRTILNFDPITNQVSAVPLSITSIAGNQPLGLNTVVTVIDQTSGSLLFFTNGALILDENHIANAGANLNGDETKSQSVAVAVRNFDLNSPYDSDYFVFYVTATNQLNYRIASFGANDNLQVDPPILLSNGVGNAIKVIDAAKPNIGDQSYLIYFDGNAGELVVRLVGAAGFGPPQNVAWTFPPEQIRFNEEKSQIFAIGPSGELAFIDFDRATGSFDVSSLEVIDFPPASSGDINGITFDESGRFAYISRGDRIYQVDLDDPALTPEPIPLPSTSIDEVLDIKLAPNGYLYFMYTNAGSGEVKIGEIQTPDLSYSDPGFLVDMDPFPGIDFCGRMFSTFSTTVHFTPTVEIEAPVDTGTGFCANNPIQLVSKITPSSMIPVSYEWSFPNSTGTSQTSDVAHLILNGQGTAEVSLKVTFSNGVVAETLAPTQINLDLQPPEVELSPDPSDIICPCSNPSNPNPSAGEGVNLADWLTIEGSPASPSSGFEYYWSAFPEKGWSPNPQANVCEPGTYYVMVRKPGEECYGYAEVEVRVVDNSTGNNLPTGRNGKWFFGNKAGIDFNDYPIFNPRPVSPPRPLDDPSLNNINPPFDPQTEHPQDIPNGVDIFYDVAGNVVFYTNGEKVWDYAHNEIPIDPTDLTATLGGDRNSNQGALIVPYPNPDQLALRTLFYIFTTQVNAPHEVKFAMLDLAQGFAPPKDDLGKIVSFDHLLFSRGTQQSAAYMDGASTFVAFKEMGSGRYRVYKIDSEGIHAPNLNGSGVLTSASRVIPGAMQFSFGGKYLVSVYSFDESGSTKSVIELFEFDVSSGDLTLYSTFYLDGLAHGIEVSLDERRLYVSIENSVWEFFINEQNVSAGATPLTSISTFNSCFAGAQNVLERSNCILASVDNISTGNYRALQRGPLPTPFIWVAQEGSSDIGFINEATGNQQSQVISPFLSMSNGGTAQKGLPRYKVPALSGSLEDPDIFGPGEICLAVNFPAKPPVSGNALYGFSITGEDIDEHTFSFIRNYEGVTTTPSGLVPFQDPNNFTEWTVNFTEPGEYTINVTVKRCGFTFPPIEHKVEVYAPPFILPDVINFCDDGSPLEIKVLNDVFYDVNDYEIEWRRSVAGNPFGPVFSNQNSVTFSDINNDIGEYIITVKHLNKTDPCEASTFVFIGPPRGLDLNLENDNLCLDDVLEAFPFVAGGSSGPFTPSGEVGDFRVFKTSNPTNPVYQLANVDRLSLAVKGLLDPGDYILEFETIDTLALSSLSSIAPKCLLVLSKPLTVLPEPPQIISRELSTSSCGLTSGELELEAADPLDRIYFDGNPVPLLPADPSNPLIYHISGLAPRSYLVELESGLTSCIRREFIVIPNASAGTTAPNFHLETSPAICGPGGIEGSLSINAPAGFKGSYEIKDFSGSTISIGVLELGVINPAVFALPSGDYIIDFFDSSGCFVASQVFEIANTFGNPLVFNQTFCFSIGGPYTISLPSFLDLSDPSIVQFEWLDSSTGITTPNDASYAVASPGEYILTIDFGSCELALEFNIEEKCGIDYRVSNAIKVAPNRNPLGSGIYRDDVVTLVTNSFIKEVEAFIYNRWGQLIHVKKYTPVISEPFHSEIIWGGIVNREQVPLGTYVMVFVFTTVENKLEKRTESLFVIR